MDAKLTELLDYTQEQQDKWEGWFAGKGNEPLGIAIGSGRLNTIGEVVRHALGVNLYFAQKLGGRPVTEWWKDPSTDAGALFRFGTEAKQALRDFIQCNPDWTRTIDLQAPGFSVQPTVRKAVVHTLVHEIRHWAQISALLRQHGMEPPPDQDLILSRAFDGN